ncbi:MAG: hypothetical protein ACRENU_13830 [Gemmatimonadaceae bacterium]
MKVAHPPRSPSRLLIAIAFIVTAIALGRLIFASSAGEPLAYTECPLRGPARIRILPGVAPEDSFPVRMHEETHAAQCESLGTWRYRGRNFTARGKLSLEAPGYCAGARARLEQGMDPARVRERLHDDAIAAFSGSLDSTEVLSALRLTCPGIARSESPSP